MLMLMRTLPVVLVVLVAFVGGCAPSDSTAALCTCAEAELYNGDECVAEADFVAPECTPDDIQVCGCDGANYTSACAAYQAGVEVKYGGACRAGPGGGTGNGGDGIDFGW